MARRAGLADRDADRIRSREAPAAPRPPACQVRACSRPSARRSSARAPTQLTQPSRRTAPAVLMSRSLLLLPRRQPSLERHLDGLIDGNPYDSCVLIHPAVRVQDLVFVSAEIQQVLTRVALQPRLGWQAVLLFNGQWVLWRDGSLRDRLEEHK